MNDPTLTPDAPDFKSANLFEAVDAIRKECPKHLDWTEVDWHFEEDAAERERLRKQTIKNKEIIERLISMSDLLDNTYIKNQLIEIKL